MPQNLSQFFPALAILALFALAASAFAAWQVFVLRKRLEVFFLGRRGKDLEDVLSEQRKRIQEIEQDFKRLRDDVARIDVMAEASIQKVGVVRFNPFEDTGGDQSFAIALLDAEDNGVVISSLFTREGTRIYAKPIVKSESRHHLSHEEREAIRRAIQRE